MLVVQREDLAANLAAYGEHDASARILSMSAQDFQRVCEIGFQHALAGKHLLEAGCLAALEVIEGQPRALKRKRRNWAEVPQSLCQPNPRLLAVMRWFEEFSGGERLRKPEILSRMSALLQPCLPDFKYYRTHAQFRSDFSGGAAFVRLSCSRGGTLNLDFGVRLDRVEDVRVLLFPPDRRPYQHLIRTISMLSGNMGPRSPHWHYPTETSWPLSWSEGVKKASTEIAHYIVDVVRPYLAQHRTPEAIRDTLLKNPRRAASVIAEPTIFAIDYLLDRRDWLEDDYRHLVSRYRPRDPHAPPNPLSCFAWSGATGVNPVATLTHAYTWVTSKWDDQLIRQSLASART